VDSIDDLEFAKHVAHCENALKRFVYFKTPSKADGEDVLQETLLAAYARRETLKNPNGFKAWLLRIAVNKCNDFYRQRAKLPGALTDSETALDNALSQSRYGITVTDIVQETLAQLDEKDVIILRLVYIDRFKQAKIAKMLDIPIGTVKSRLHTAKQHFKDVYPCPPQQQPKAGRSQCELLAYASKGEREMEKLPNVLPEYTIVKSNEAPFSVKWEELTGWFVVPKLGEKLSWGIYDGPEKKRAEWYENEVTGRASVHGIEGVEIISKEHSSEQHELMCENRNLTSTLVAQLTDTHCRYLAHSAMDGDTRRMRTFLDGDEFSDWSFGEDNCGNEINLKPKGLIQREGNIITTKNVPFLLDVVGRYTVTIGGKPYDCICVINIITNNVGVMSEQFIDQNGRTVLWRRFNRDDWNMKTYKQPWSEKFPTNDRLTVNGQLYVHWYDCITDYIL